MNNTRTTHTLAENRRLQLHYIFTVYALARKAAQAGKLDPGRLNKALGIVQCKVYHTSTGEDYQSTTHGCTCKDWEFHTASKRQTADGYRYTGPCKHMIAEMLLARMNDLIMADAAQIGQDSLAVVSLTV